VESLFITHAATKLNSSGRLVDISNSNNNDAAAAAASSNHHHHQNIVWCEGLVRRPVPSFVTAAMLTSTTRTTTI